METVDGELNRLHIVEAPAVEDSGPRPRSSQRLRFEAETETIIKKYGDLEAIRDRLGLTRRRICEELLVDPSCWTRWTKDGATAPHHIYKMLALLLEQKSKNPTALAMDSNATLQSVKRLEFQLRHEMHTAVEDSAMHVAEALRQEFQERLRASESSLRESLLQLEEPLKKREELGLGWKFMLIVNTLALAYLLFF